jgi:uncharacterized protein (UPF0332 family)
MKEFADGEWARALLSFKSSEQLLSIDPDSSASRAYYAAFHAVTALFALRNQEFSKHAALRSALHRDLINTGQWTADLGQDYDFLMDLRETGDYGGLRHVSAEDAQSAIQSARRVLAAVQSICPDLKIST